MSNVRPPSEDVRTVPPRPGDEDRAVPELLTVGEHGDGPGLELLPALAGIVGAEEVAAKTEEKNAVTLEREDAEVGALVQGGRVTQFSPLSSDR